MITAKTPLYALLGAPVGHSMSPALHNTAFELTGIDGCYLAFETDEEHLEKSVAALVTLGARGWNVTMPCKTKMAALCDVLSPEAAAIGAVNTVVNTDGLLTGHTTDGAGFFNNVREHGFDPAGKKIVLLGAGGAARAIAVRSTFEDVGELVIYNRNAAKARALADETGARAEDMENTAALAGDLKSADLLVNATSVGMGADVSPVAPQLLHPGLTVVDIIYNPRETRLMREAAAADANVIGGLGMLLHQGACAFRLWTGVDFPVQAVRRRVFG